MTSLFPGTTVPPPAARWPGVTQKRSFSDGVMGPAEQTFLSGHQGDDDTGALISDVQFKPLRRRPDLKFNTEEIIYVYTKQKNETLGAAKQATKKTGLHPHHLNQDLELKAAIFWNELRNYAHTQGDAINPNVIEEIVKFAFVDGDFIDAEHDPFPSQNVREFYRRFKLACESQDFRDYYMYPLTPSTFTTTWMPEGIVRTTTPGGDWRSVYHPLHLKKVTIGMRGRHKLINRFDTSLQAGRCLWDTVKLYSLDSLEDNDMLLCSDQWLLLKQLPRDIKRSIVIPRIRGIQERGSAKIQPPHVGMYAPAADYPNIRYHNEVFDSILLQPGMPGRGFQPKTNYLLHTDSLISIDHLATGLLRPPQLAPVEGGAAPAPERLPVPVQAERSILCVRMAKWFIGHVQIAGDFNDWPFIIQYEKTGVFTKDLMCEDVYIGK